MLIIKIVLFSGGKYELGFEPLKRDVIPGSAGVSPASSSFSLPTGWRDAGAPRGLCCVKMRFVIL